MKTCSKCKRELELDQFVNSERYLDGKYPLCKDCRRQIRLKWLENNPLCSKCKERPHMPGTGWCWECEDLKRRTKPKKFIRNPSNPHPELCSKCRVSERTYYSVWCLGCIAESRRKWSRIRRGVPDERKRKATARHYVNTLIKRGKLKYGPCYLCGEQSVHKHHLNYKDRSVDVIDLCFGCHVVVHRALRKLLTEYSVGV